MEPTAQPQSGDLFFVLDDQGQWGHALCFVALDESNPGNAVFRDDREETYTFPLKASWLKPARVTSPEDAVDPVERAENRRYRQRSRVTAEQRANRKLTDKQRVLIFTLGRRRGMGIEDLRAMAPEGSIRKLTVRQAAGLIDTLVGPGRKVGT